MSAGGPSFGRWPTPLTANPRPDYGGGAMAIGGIIRPPVDLSGRMPGPKGSRRSAEAGLWGA